jgi:hypothetical protein
MSTLPRVLKNYVAYLDGYGYAGKVPELKPPQIKIKTTDYEAGGMAGTAEVDMGGGYGGATYEQLIQTVEPEAIYKYKGSNGTTARTQFSNMQFANTRAEAYWRLYEALDPSQPGGSQICLPPSQRLYSDLCSIRWNKNPEDNKVVQLESKKDLCARIGRSPDEGDAVVMAWYRGTKGANIQGGWKQNNRNQRPSVKLGRGANAYSRGRH